MAIRANREGPPSRRSFFPRFAGKRKAVRLAAVPVLLILVILTFDKTLFLFRLAGAALLTGQNSGSRFVALADCAYRRSSLLPRLTAESENPEFVAAWIAAHLQHNDGRIREPETASFLERVTTRFPENVVLDSLGFYGHRTGPRDWGNFDPLFFRLARDPEFNALSLGVLTRCFQDGRLPPDALAPLLGYLDWMKNSALADGLRQWAAGAGLSGEVRLSAAPVPTSEAPGGRPDPEAVRKALSRALGVDAVELALGDELLNVGRGIGMGDDGNPWEFIDMSRREPFASGSFTGGADAAAGSALRVMGFFARPEPGRVACRAGFGRRAAIPIGTGTYLFHFLYRTWGAEERPSFWLAAPEFIPEHELRPTHGVWRRVLYVFRNGELGIPELEPHLRMWGTGIVWFTGIGLFEVEVRSPDLPPAKEALFYE